MQPETRPLDMAVGEGEGGRTGRAACKHTHERTWNSQPARICCKTPRLRELNLGICDNLEGWGGVGGSSKREGT